MGVRSYRTWQGCIYRAVLREQMRILRGAVSSSHLFIILPQEPQYRGGEGWFKGYPNLPPYKPRWVILSKTRYSGFLFIPFNFHKKKFLKNNLKINTLLFHNSIICFQNLKNWILWVIHPWIGSTKKNKSVESKLSLLSQIVAYTSRPLHTNA